MDLVLILDQTPTTQQHQQGEAERERVQNVKRREESS
jgi:hypothetical protein